LISPRSNILLGKEVRATRDQVRERIDGSDDHAAAMRVRRLEPKIGGCVAQRETTGSQRLDELDGGEALKAIGLAAGTRHCTPQRSKRPLSAGARCPIARTIRNPVGERLCGPRVVASLPPGALA
jgi:hypothetical protein